MPNRIEWIDIYKGIGIFFIVLGHVPISSVLRDYVYSFHVPMFFFISGFLFSIDKYDNFLSFLKKKIQTLIIPYFLFSFISICIFDDPININTFNVMLESTRNKIYFNVPLWFLTCLFLTEILFYISRKYIKNTVILTIFIILLSFVGYGTLFEPKLYWTFDSSMYYLLFFLIGNVIKNFENHPIVQNEKTIIISIFCISINIISLIKPSLLYWIRDFNLYIYWLILGLAGSITYMVLAKRITSSKIISFFGKNSLIVLALHISVAFKIINSLNYFIKAQNVLLEILYTIIAMIILIPFIYITNTYLPFLLGQHIKNSKNLPKNI